MNAERDEVDDFLALAGRGFDGEAEVLAGDEQRVERIERAVQKRYAARPRPRPRRLAASVAGGVFAAGVAFAAWRGVGAGEGTKPVSSATPRKSVAGLSSSVPLPVPLTSTKSVESVPSAASSTPLAPWAGGAPSVVARASAHSTSALAAPIELNTTAATLFAAANHARVAGNVAQAIALSQQLLARFPRSAQAYSTHLSLGMLRLQQGQATLALAEFQAYEAQGSGDAMAEALWGKAQALRALARSKEEMETLNELVRKVPRAAYAAAAQKRLVGLQ